MNGILVNTQEQLMNGFLPSFQKLISDEMSSENCTHINTDNINYERRESLLSQFD